MNISPISFNASRPIRHIIPTECGGMVEQPSYTNDGGNYVYISNSKLYPTYRNSSANTQRGVLIYETDTPDKERIAQWFYYG